MNPAIEKRLSTMATAVLAQIALKHPKYQEHALRIIVERHRWDVEGCGGRFKETVDAVSTWIEEQEAR